MVTLPNEFVATKYPGYFWNIDDNKLYSVKITGQLKPMKSGFAGEMINGRWKPNYNVPVYKVSVAGTRKILLIRDLEKLTAANTVFPVYSQPKIV